MSSETPPNAKRGFFARLVPPTVAGKTAWVTFLVLLLTIIAVWITRRWGPQSVAPGDAITWTRMLLEFLLVLLIPMVLYAGIKRWNQVIEGLYPDIDQAWEAGINTLSAQGISLSD